MTTTTAAPSWDGHGPIPISASQLATFETCRRLWGFEKIEGRPKTETKATADGTAIHQEVEDYFRHGTKPTRPESQILLTLLPAPDPSLVPEAAFELAWPGVDALLRGKIDLVDPRTHTIYDHKTTTNIDRYAKSSDELRLDAQTVMYGLAYRAIFSKVEVANLRWNYVKREQPKTRPPQTLPVDLVQDLTLLEEGLQKWHPIVVDLVQITKSRVRALDIPANPGDACFKFGGCPFRGECPDYAGKRKVVEETVSDPALLAYLASLGAATPPPSPEPMNDPAPKPEASTNIPVAPAMPLLDAVRIAFDVKSEVVPPDAQPNVSRIEPPPPPINEQKRGRGRPKKLASEGVQAEPILEQPFDVPPPPTPVTESAYKEPTLSFIYTDQPSPSASQSDDELVAFVEMTIHSVSESDPIQIRLDSARLAMDLLSYRQKKV